MECNIEPIRQAILISKPGYSMQCKFATPCKYYKKESDTCNDNEEANGYCGYHRQFKNLLNIKTSITI
jgi:hypothetical protein